MNFACQSGKRRNSAFFRLIVAAALDPFDKRPPSDVLRVWQRVRSEH